ncbi:response regulator transcription factor [Nocardioides sp. R1-1]|uniref:helix-turn-helix transcriptional regulator n=1 Tax=Nocardioides sp. R1-1 TaxID=3383502 RepID=UPI0038D17E57
MHAADRVSTRHPVSDRLIDLLGDLASLDAPDEAATAAPQLLERLAEDGGAAACQLDTALTHADDLQAPAFQTVASVGYSPEVSSHLRAELAPSPHGRRVLAATGGLRIDEDDPFHFRGSDHYREVLHPAGYDDGISIALRDPGARLVGLLHLSARSTRDFAPELVGALAPLGRAFARLTTVATCSSPDVTLPPEYAAVRLDAAGRATPVVGRAPLHAALDTELLGIVRSILGSGTRFATFLHQQAGRLVEVRVHCPSGRAATHQPCTVATRPAASTLGLTLRQLEVLTAVATGAGNREIADELCLTQRTVAAHVEAILARLDTPSRAGAAAKATAAGVLLPSADPESVRSLARVLGRPVT